MNNKEQYYEMIASLIEDGLIREIYHDDDMSILNLAEKIYMVNLIDINGKIRKCVGGIVIPQSAAEYVAGNLKNYNKYITRYQKNLLTVVFSEDFIKLIKSYKNETLKNGPSEFIDYEMEERLAKKMKDM